MKNSYTEAEIDSMVADVTTKLDALLKSEGAALVKKGEDAPSGEPMQMSAPDASASPEASASAPAPEASPSPEESPDASPSPAPEGSEPQGLASLEELVQAYSSLSPEELQMHAQALAQVMQGQQAQPAAPVIAWIRLPLRLCTRPRQEPAEELATSLPFMIKL